MWNAGERIEGYTNFSWVVILAAGMRVGVPPEIGANLLGILSGGLLLATLVLFSSRRYGAGDPFVWLAPLLLAGHRSFTAWSTGGLETMFFTLLAFCGLARFLDERGARLRFPPASSLLLAGAALTRPEGMLFAGIAGALLVADLSRGRRKLREVAVWGLPLVAIVGTHLLWRHAYYGFWLPNTFYAKVPGAWWEQGARYLGAFVSDYRLAAFLPLALLALALRRDVERGLFLVVLLLYGSYVWYVGGDRFEYRFLVVVAPYLYWLMADGLRSLARQTPTPTARHAGVAIATLGAIGLAVTTLVSGRGPQTGQIRDGVAGLSVVRDYASRRAAEGRFLRGLIEQGLLPDDLVLCVGGAGAVPYYTGWPTVDRRGINDLKIARLPLVERGVVAHERDAPYAYLLERRVVVFDVFNRLVYDELDPRRPRVIEHDSTVLPVKTVRAGDRYLIFATLVSDEELRRTFGKLEILD